MPESIGNECFPMCNDAEFPKWDHEPGGDLNAEQINQVNISRPSSRRRALRPYWSQAQPARAFGADYTPVTDARLANPEPENWLMTGGNYKGWSYSTLDQINAHDVKSLVRSGVFNHGGLPAVNHLRSSITESCSSRRRSR